MPIIVPQLAATVALDDLLPFVLPTVPNCPTQTVLHALRQAAIEFCQKTNAWRSYQGDIYTVDGVTEYTFVLEPGQAVHKVLQAFLDGREIGIINPGEGRSLDAVESTGPYIYCGMSTFELRPVQREDLLIQTYSALMPTDDAMTLPGDFRRYSQVIANGALAHLMEMPRADWYSPVEADRRRTRFVTRMSSVAAAALRGHSKHKASKASRFF